MRKSSTHDKAEQRYCAVRVALAGQHQLTHRAAAEQHAGKACQKEAQHIPQCIGMRNRLRSKAKLEEGAACYRGQHNIRSSSSRNNSHKAPQHFSFSKEYEVTQTGNHAEACTLRQIADY